YVAQNIRADHLAILPDSDGACSVKDGAGLLVNQEAQQTEMSTTTKEQSASNNDTNNTDIESKLSELYGKKAILKKMIESATDEDREKLQSQYDALDAEVKKLEGIPEQKIQNELLSKIAEVMMSVNKQVTNTTQTKTVDNANSLLPGTVSDDTVRLPDKGNTKQWSFNTIRMELERLLNEKFATGKPENTTRAYVVDVFPTYFVYNVYQNNQDIAYYQTYSIDTESNAVVLGGDQIEITIATKYIMPDGVVLNTVTGLEKKNVAVEDARIAGSPNSPETEAARHRIEELRKKVLELTVKLYEITGRTKHGNTLSQEDWQRVKKIQDVLDKAREFVNKEMQYVKGTGVVRHDDVSKMDKTTQLAILTAHNY
ncbi:MAG: hypothetical protein LBK82_00800, partial [Planctomycetaceae bacterium]|nr:hypothetical protein [Planctomycetaceae bacterium]